jgi:hypothetical protein
MTAARFPDFSEGADISALRFGQLPGPLLLDNYQRPYVWNADKANQLLWDLRDHAHAHGSNVFYYMGTLLLHQPDKKDGNGRNILNVIDGQQRLTTLALLHRAIHGELPEPIEFQFRSTISHRHIREVNQVIRDTVSCDDETLQTLLDNLTFTVVAVNQEDLAFTLFDTQNSRGVPLATTDLLKAFHLRAIGGSQSVRGEVRRDRDHPCRQEHIQKACAQSWEKLQISEEANMSEGSEDFAPDLFHYYLWRARNWRGQHTLTRETRDQILESFQKRAVPSERMELVPLYPAPGNRLARWLTLDSSGDVRIATGEFRLTDDPAELPFSLRQPVHKGLGFFLYTARYAALTRRLFRDTPVSEGLVKYRGFLTDVASGNSPYLRQLHRLAVLMYYDQFGEEKLLQFAWALEYVLGAIRLTKQRVFQRSAMKYLEEARLNLLDVIAGAYRPEEVFQFLMRPEHRVGDDHQLKDAYADGRPDGNGIQARYYDQLWSYFVEYGPFQSLNYDNFDCGLREGT